MKEIERGREECAEGLCQEVTFERRAGWGGPLSRGVWEEYSSKGNSVCLLSWAEEQ